MRSNKGKAPQKEIAMKRSPFIQEGSKKKATSQGPGRLTANSYWVPEGLIYKGKTVRPGIFVNTTGKSKKEKGRAFKLAKNVGRQG